ncbi:MAG: DUF3526 domain-containing protein [Acidobacteria bacterium]|nr:DUF3526 domain-containing protein [Acidobacteriota bacterium]
MLGRIIRHELRNLSADRTLTLVVMIFALLIGYGLYNGATWVDFQRATLRAAGEEEIARIAGARAVIEEIDSGRSEVPRFADPRSPAFAGGAGGARYAVMPPGPLAALAVGQSDLYPYYFKVTRQSRQTFTGNDEIENPALLSAGRFDPAFVIIYLYPLLILALCYNLLSQEKEQGTLQMIMSQPVALRTFVFGKVLLRATVVLVPAIVLTLIGFLALGGEIFAEGAWWRCLLWVLVVAAYGLFWFGAAILVNSIGGASASNALALAGMWLLLVLVLPSLLGVAASTSYPAPSRVEMIQAVRRASAEASAQGSRLLARYYEDHPELAPAGGAPDMNDFYARSIAVQTETEKMMQPVMEYFDRQVLGQQHLSENFRFLSPAVITQAALNDLSGASAHRYRHFLGLVEQFHHRWLEYFNPRILRQARLTARDYDSFPVFAFKEEPAGAVVARVMKGLLGLLVTTAVVVWLALRRLRRYPLTA